MKTAKNILIVVLILMVAFLVVFSKIQLGYAEKEKEKAIVAQVMADENALQAAAQAELAMLNAAEAELLKTQLELCKSSK